MAKADELRATLPSFLDDVLSGGNSRMLANYLTVNSNLPGGEPNEELAGALADEMAQRVPEKGAQLWGLVVTWADLGPEQAPSGSPQEFLPYCAAVCIGAMAEASDMWWLSGLDRLRDLASDPRAHVRQAVVNGLRRALRADFLIAADEFIAWIDEGDLAEMRAIAEATCEPLLLRQDENAAAAMALHRALIDAFSLLPDTKRGIDAYEALRQTLSYSLSYAVAAFPEQGFEDLGRWATEGDDPLKELVKQNLMQGRLMNVYQAEAEALLRQLKDS